MKMLIKTANDFEEYSQYKFNNLKPVGEMGKELNSSTTLCFIGSDYIAKIDYWADSYYTNTINVWFNDYKNSNEFYGAKFDLERRSNRNIIHTLKTLEEFMAEIGKEDCLERGR